MAAVSKVTEEVVSKVRARLADDKTLTQQALAAELKLDRKTIAKAMLVVTAASQPSDPKGDTGIALLAHANITPSPLNPRKTFDPDELAELAESIAVNGLLQNLVVRDGPEGGFILVAGERRFRAIGLLIANGRWSAPLPCRIIEADDGAHVALALLENLHRQDVAPLEEADAFAQLQAINKEVWTAQAIAERIGRTTRYVYQRLAMAMEIQEKVISAQWNNWRNSETDAEARYIVAGAPGDSDPAPAARPGRAENFRGSALAGPVSGGLPLASPALLARLG
jgi:ParB/RepB/Spo0J family partition protein